MTFWILTQIDRSKLSNQARRSQHLFDVLTDDIQRYLPGFTRISLPGKRPIFIGTVRR